MLNRVLSEIGLVALYQSPTDVKLLCLQRFVRLFAYGASTLNLVMFLQTLGISQLRIGLFMTLTLVGDVCMSLMLTMIADGIGRKVILALGAALMIGSGIAFSLCSDYWALLAAAVLGVISPSGNEIGPFRAVEESIVAHLTTPSNRSDIYAWYSLVGAAGTAFGVMTCGWVVQHLTDGLGWQIEKAYRVVFLAYAALGLVKFLLTLCLSSAVEAEKKPQKPIQGDAESAPLLGDRPIAVPEQPKQKASIRSLLPDISRSSLPVIVPLCLLFMMDSFASGLAPLSYTTYFFRWKYSVAEGTLGTLFFVTSIIAAASTLVASSIAKRFGNVKTMVFTHLPSAVFLALIPIPNNISLSMTFLILRSCTQSMDVAPRSAFLAAIILPQERTAVMGLMNVLKTLAQSVGPSVTGALVHSNLFWVAFLCSGSLKAAYDLGVLTLFKSHEHDRHREEE
ncbi:major facilitator superfamily domain-containing protein [Thelonectria olida]|uniref:Major facilitator superfamily domain-containing protein n=1 Tax=Thelonectria olida TaxID=1576542 RepID=A0A9P8WAH6_9HYPO|nr:major facilitator superfamily domain-containing protein [Thelonectria olida]